MTEPAHITYGRHTLAEAATVATFTTPDPGNQLRGQLINAILSGNYESATHLLLELSGGFEPQP